MPETRLSEFENAIMNRLLQGDHAMLERLRNQFESCSWSRERTGVGFFIEFQVPDTCLLISPRSCRIGDVVATVRGLEHGAGFVLFISEGKIQTLEGFSYDEPWPESIDSFSVSYAYKDRKLPF